MYVYTHGGRDTVLITPSRDTYVQVTDRWNKSTYPGSGHCHREQTDVDRIGTDMEGTHLWCSGRILTLSTGQQNIICLDVKQQVEKNKNRRKREIAIPTSTFAQRRESGIHGRFEMINDRRRNFRGYFTVRRHHHTQADVPKNAHA